MNFQVPFYSILNVFLLGIIFICGISGILWESAPDLFRQITTLEIPENWGYIIALLVVGLLYETGFIINRISSVLIEPILKRIVPFCDYKKYNQKKVQYPILECLSREYALCRGHIALWVILLLLYLFQKMILFLFQSCWLWCKWLILPAAMLGIIILFGLSMKKYAQKIQELINDEDIDETPK